MKMDEPRNQLIVQNLYTGGVCIQMIINDLCMSLFVTRIEIFVQVAQGAAQVQSLQQISCTRTCAQKVCICALPPI